LAAAIKQKTGVDPELIPGTRGIFDVVVDEQMIFSKHDAGRFPEDDEVLAKLPG
jgi:selT/selW/selH-like putative selenoprotein